MGVTITLPRRLHKLTRTFKGLGNRTKTESLRVALGREIRDLRKILKKDNYSVSAINEKMKELIRQNKALWEMLDK